MRSTASARQLYSPDPVPGDQSLWPGYIARELNKIAAIVNAPTKLETLHATPDKPRDGDFVKADGTDWNPGVGSGLYYYDGSTWVFIA